MAQFPEFPERAHGIASPTDGFTATRVPFPKTVADFQQDPRVSWSKVEGKWLLEDDDGSEWDYNEKAQKWLPMLDQAAIEQQGQAYVVEGVDENEPAQPSKKRKTSNHDEQVRQFEAPILASANNIEKTGDATSNKKKALVNKPAKEAAPNTAVYVMSIPLDATVDEVAKVFGRCGVIAEEIDSGKPRIKMYTDEDGKFKGDALVVFFKAESIRLSIMILDETDFRLGEKGPSGPMRVIEADRSYKKLQDRPKEGSDEADKKNKGRSRDQQKIIKKTKRLNDKLADWSDDDIAAAPPTNSRFDKVVILRHMFTLEEIEEDPAAILDIKEDVRGECAKFGDVTNVQLFDKEPDGVLSVRFSNSDSARTCVRMMEGRKFSGLAVAASISTGDEKFKKTRVKKAVLLEDSETDEEGRMDRFGDFLEGR